VERKHNKRTEKRQPNGCQHKNRTPAFADTLRRPLFSRPRHPHVGGFICGWFEEDGRQENRRENIKYVTSGSPLD